ncbi:flavodoxin family protein [Chloroflexota bacterium]
MPKGLVAYDSASGNTEKMAVAIGRGMRKAGLDVEVKRVRNVAFDELLDADAIVLGAPTYFSTMSMHMKEFIDKVSHRVYPDKLKDKVGAAFTSYKTVGAETALLSIILAMFVHGMVIVGHQSGQIGAISSETPDDNCIAECEVFGERIANLTKAVAKAG